MVWLLVKYILSAAMRDRLLLSFLLLVCIGVSLSIFLGSAAIIEKDQFSLVFMASGLRIGGVFTLVLFVVFYIRRSFETRDVDYLLSRPITRFQFLLSHMVAFFVLASVAAFIIFTIIWIMAGAGLPQMGLLMWGGSIWAEYMMMVMVALFFALVLSSAVSATLITLAFYVLARLMGDILGIVNTDTGESGAIFFLEKIMSLISIFIPRLDLMGQSSWLLYGMDETVRLPFIFLQGTVFCGLVFFAAFIDLKRRQF